MFWVGIISNELVGHWKVDECIKLTSPAYIELLKASLQAEIKKTVAFRGKFLFMNESTPTHATSETNECLYKLGLKNDKFMAWPLFLAGFKLCQGPLEHCQEVDL